MSTFNPRVEVSSFRFRAEFYRRDGHEDEARQLEIMAQRYDELADDMAVGARRTIRREIGIVHQVVNGLQRR